MSAFHRDASFARDVVIIGGCGRVGLPLAIAFADRGADVAVYDVDPAAVQQVSHGGLPFAEPGAQAMLERAVAGQRLAASADPAVVGTAEYVVVVIGTPVEAHLSPGEGAIPRALERIFESVTLPGEVLVVVDDPADRTRLAVQRLAGREHRLRCLVNTYGPGPANAIRYGIEQAATPVAVVTMADGCDDAGQIDDLVRLVERGVAVAAASRYMAGGQQVGGPLVKGLISATAGRTLRLLARVGTRDATNSFKAYSTAFVRAVGIDSRDGFETGIELTAKARRLRLPVAEIPTIWLDRQHGRSNFLMAAWLPIYLRWYRFAFGSRLTVAELRARARGRRP